MKTNKGLLFFLIVFIAPVIFTGCYNQGAVEGINPYEGQRVGDLPDKEKVRLALATAIELESVGLYKEAIVQYERARKLDSTQRQVSKRLAVLYDTVDRYTKAREEYVTALTLYPYDAQLLSDYGYFCYRRGNLERSEEYLRRAVEVDPFLDIAWINLGVTLAEMERYKESLRCFEQVRPEPEALANLGTILARQGKYDEAREALEEAIRLDPNLIEAQDVLDSIDEHQAGK